MFLHVHVFWLAKLSKKPTESWRKALRAKVCFTLNWNCSQIFFSSEDSIKCLHRFKLSSWWLLASSSKRENNWRHVNYTDVGSCKQCLGLLCWLCYVVEIKLTGNEQASFDYLLSGWTLREWTCVWSQICLFKEH